MATLDSVSTSLPSGSLHPIAPSRLHGVKGRPDAVAVGTIVWLSSELMFFAALFAAYFTIRNVAIAQTPPGGQSLWQVDSAHLNPLVAGGFTFLLFLSSITCQIGVMAAERGEVKRSGSFLNIGKWGMREWYILTFVLGAIFIAGQVYEYAHLISIGATVSSDPYFSLFFLATGFHGLHVLGGLIAFLLVLGRTYYARRFTHEQAVNAVVVSYYWHFVDLIWLVLFAVIYLLK